MIPIAHRMNCLGTKTACQVMRDGYTGYGLAAGLLEFRKVIADHVAETRNVAVHPDEIAVTPGAKPIVFFTLLALVNAGDEVIYPDPGFPVYESAINFVSARGIPLPLKEEMNFRFRLNYLTNAISDRTKLLILNSSQNPTGGILQPDALKAIAHLAQQHDFYVLSDEVYSRIHYEEDSHSIISYPGMKDRTIPVDSHSKTYSMMGWRLGYSIAPKPLTE